MTAPVTVLEPLQVVDSMLIATDVPEADYGVWSSGTTYAVGQRCILTTGVHKVYESLVAANINHPPATSPDQWAVVGPTNRWALFDRSNSTQTVKPSSMSFQLRPPGSINTLALLNLTGATSVRVRMIHATYGTVYDKTYSLASLPADTGWWSWFFDARTAPSLMLALDLPGLQGCDLYVDITGTTELAVGVLLIGQARGFGMGMLSGAKAGIQDYSRKETDDFGNTVLVQRAFAKRLDLSVPILAEQTDDVADLLARLRATPCLWVGLSSRGITVLYGFYKEFEIVLTNGRISECSLQLEGLT